MSFSSSPYTDLILPTPNEDNSTYGTILNTYFQALETKLKNLSDRINAAGVGDSSTLAQINSDIAEFEENTSSILPDPYSGNYTTVSTWPAFNTELTALGLSPPQTASEIEAFFAGSDFTSFVNFLNGKLTALDTLVATAEQDICIANKYSDVVLNPTDYFVWTKTAESTHYFVRDGGGTTSTGYPGAKISAGTISGVKYHPGTGYPPPNGGVVNTTMVTALPSVTGYALSDTGTTVVLAHHPDISFVSGSTVYINQPSYTGGVYDTTYTFQLSADWYGSGPYARYYSAYGGSIYADVYEYFMICTTYTLSLPAPDTSTC